MIRFYSDMKASAETGVTGVCSTSSYGRGPSFPSAFGMISSAWGFGIFLSTLSGLYGANPHAAKPALIFLDVIAVSLAGPYRGKMLAADFIYTSSF
jgi:hypothetical protein